MDNNQIVIIALFSVIIFLLLTIIIGLFAFIFFNKIKKNQTIGTKNKIDTPVVFNKETFKELIKEAQPTDKKIAGLCGICEKELAEEDHFEIDNIHFCKEHYNLYIKNDWQEISDQRTTADTPEAGIYIYNFQRSLWQNEKVPSFIVCEYKIDVNTDQIETYVKLTVLKNMAPQLEERLNQSKVLQ